MKGLNKENGMFHIEDHIDLIDRLKLPNESKLLGYSLWFHKGEKSGFVHEFNFNFVTAKSTEHNFSYSLSKRIQHGMNLDKCIYDLETVTMIQHIFNWYTSVSPKVHYVIHVLMNNENKYHTEPVKLIYS